MNCRICGAVLRRTFVDLGSMPLANSYLSPGDEPDERRYPLHVRVCEDCLLVQVEDVVSVEDIFDDYAYLSAYSDTWVEHTRRFTEDAAARFNLGSDSFILELASNDGTLLKHFIRLGFSVLGIEPARNVAQIANEAGVPTEACFFSHEVAKSMRADGIRADLVVGNNVYGHVPALNDFTAGIKEILAPRGVLSLEVPHILNLIEQVQFDTIYHEHFSYFSFHAAEVSLRRHGLRVFDVERLSTHGGSLRILGCHEDDDRPEVHRVAEMRDLEARVGLNRIETYDGFAGKVDHCRRKLVEFLTDAKDNRLTVAAYGAAAKGNTLLCYCGITTDDVAYVVDRNPLKQATLLPGSHLPVYAPEHVDETRPSYLLILPWNLADEIQEQMAHVRKWGCRFVIPVPEVRILA